ncbi:hypothetical protein KVT40_000141 [Elsinoe batatas]|uniref:Uncharacterized protein n=1 Tax=Elsinoe batatas TaxID=2601811 RepID=A0A8K0L6T5_9PEZI|nr:hypothetical protein KVT40_000141 [Elsinoe batatas]
MVHDTVVLLLPKPSDGFRHAPHTLTQARSTFSTCELSLTIFFDCSPLPTIYRLVRSILCPFSHLTPALIPLFTTFPTTSLHTLSKQISPRLPCFHRRHPDHAVTVTPG